MKDFRNLAEGLVIGVIFTVLHYYVFSKLNDVHLAGVLMACVGIAIGFRYELFPTVLVILGCMAASLLVGYTYNAGFPYRTQILLTVLNSSAVMTQIILGILFAKLIEVCKKLGKLL